MSTAAKTTNTAKTTNEVTLVQIITSIKAIKAECARVNTVGSALQADIHKLACSVLAHTAKHGNINVLTQFIDALPPMLRVNSVQKWFETFGQVSFKAAVEGDKPTWRIDRTKKVRLGDAMAKPFWKFKANEGQPYEALNLDAYIDQQIKKLSKDKAEILKANPNADVSKQSALIMMLKTHNPQASAN